MPHEDYCYALERENHALNEKYESLRQQLAEANHAHEFMSQQYLDALKERDQLRAQINLLISAIKVVEIDSEEVLDFDEFTAMCVPIDAYHGLVEAAEATPDQSLAEYRNKVIEAFVNEFSRHVGGDGDFWLHELQDFAIKEQP